MTPSAKIFSLLKRRTLLTLVAICLAIGAAGPIYYFATVSLKPVKEAISWPPHLFYFAPTVKNYIEVFSREPFGLYVLNSIVISLSTVCVGLILGTPAGYALSRMRFKMKQGLLFSILAVRMIPPICIALPIFLIFNNLRLLDTRFGLVIIYLTFALPLIIWLMKTFFDDIPFTLDEAAIVDGATPWQVFVRIAFPVARQGTITAGVLTWVLSWNEFLYAMLLTRWDARTAPVAINSFLEFENLTWGTIAASSVTVMAPVIAVAVVLRSYLIRGWTMGAIKE